MQALGLETVRSRFAMLATDSKVEEPPAMLAAASNVNKLQESRSCRTEFKSVSHDKRMQNTLQAKH